MEDSIRLGRVLNIPIGVNWSIVAVAALFTLVLAFQALPQSVPSSGPGVRLLAATIGIAVFFASILAHELGHAIAALNHGVAVKGITLWLLGGVAKLDRPAPTARAEFQIAVAGPAVSFALGVFFVALTVIVVSVTSLTLVAAVLGWLGGINMLLAVFNLVPAAPLDGGRILTALLWKRSGDAEEARLISGRCGLVFSVVLVAGGVIQVVGFGQLGGWLTVLVGMFTFAAARSEIAGAVIRRRLLTSPVAPFTTTHPSTVPDTVTVGQLLDRAGPATGVAHPVVRWSNEPVGFVVPAEAAAQLSPPERAWTRVGQVMHHPDGIVRVSGATSVDELLRRWEAGAPPLAIVTDERSNATVGTITDAQVRELLRPPDLWGRERSERPGIAPTLG
jgi:Zn-dependent protease